jgi:16S rRNA G527 N7-methylase RsmG
MHAEAPEILKASLEEISKPEKEKELKDFALKVFDWNKTTNLVSKKFHPRKHISSHH